MAGSSSASRTAVESLEIRRLLSGVAYTGFPQEPLARIPSDVQVNYGRGLTGAGSRSFFVASEVAHGEELWVSGGSQATTFRVADIRVGAVGAQIGPLLSAGNNVYFSADDGTHGLELWRSDGTVDGTKLVADVAPGSAGSFAKPLFVHEDFVYFSATVADQTLLLRTSDATPEPQVVRDFDGIRFLADFFELHGDLIFLTGSDSSSLYRTDGTPKGTELIAFLPGGAPGQGRIPTSLNGLTFFRTGLNSDSRIYATDGTTAGTRLLAQFAFSPALYQANHPDLTVFKNRLYFIGGGSDTGSELWSTDGTPEGTALLRDFNPGPSGSRFLLPGGVVDSPRLTLVRGNSSTFREIWSTDGTPAGTMGIPIFPATIYRGLAVLDGSTFVGTDSGIWRTDGTDDTTVASWVSVDDQMSSFSQRLEARSGDSLRYLNNRTIWALSPDDIAPPVVVNAYANPPGGFEVFFSEDVARNVRPEAFRIESLDDGAVINPISYTITQIDRLGRGVGVRFPNLPNRLLPDGNYRGTLLPGTVTDSVGLSVQGSVNVDFYSLLGDIDNNRRVDVQDFVFLSASFGRTPGIFGGDLDHSGRVDLTDFTLLASQFGKSVPPSLQRTAAAGKPVGQSLSRVPASHLIATHGKLSADVLNLAL